MVYEDVKKNIKIVIYSKQKSVVEDVVKKLEEDEYKIEITDDLDKILSSRWKRPRIVLFFYNDKSEIEEVKIKNKNTELIAHDINNINIEIIRIELMYASRIIEKEEKINYEKYKLEIVGNLVESISHRVQSNLLILSASQDIIKMLTEDLKENDQKRDVLNNLYEKNNNALEKSNLLLQLISNATNLSSESIMHCSEIEEIVNNILDEYVKENLVNFKMREKIKIGSYICGPLNDIIFIICRIIKQMIIEENKNIETVQEVYEHLIQEGFDRKDMLIALGGGVTGDLTGFVAATYLRGIRFIQVPTTLLSQVDSSIGGKTGVDFRKYKNMVGAFHQPSLVYMNLSTLASLNEEQFSCGMAEIIKAGLIEEQSFFHWLSENHEGIQKRNSKLLAEMIYRSCKIKGDVVEEDPTEKGIRAILNFGHTIGHAVEKLKDFSMLHGQCVAAGYVAAAYLSLQRGLISTEDLFEIEKINRMYGLPNRVSDLDAKDVLAATKKDKKMSQGSIKFVLLQKMGTAIVDTSLTDDEILCGIQYILGE